MNEMVPETLTVLPDPKLFRAARWGQRVCLGVAAIGILFGLMPLLGIHLSGSSSTAARASLPFLVTALLCGISLLLSQSEWTGVAITYAGRATNLLVLCAAVAILFSSRTGGGTSPLRESALLAARFSLGFVVLALVVVLVDKTNWLINQVVDVLVCGLCLLGLLLVSDATFGRFALFGRATGSPGAAALLICLVALTVAVALRQAEHGVLSIFLGVGVGSKLARIFAPVLIALPFVWEALSEWMSRVSPARHLNAALAASAGVAVAVGILLFFTWHISKMENRIHDLVLRDEATRLYNFRGFQMLAEHALRLAQRANVPFSVLYVDLENLAEIHTELGPNVAAATLKEAGELLRATFRESDIKGRIGADAFAVAGQFDRAGISVAALRLEAATAARSARSNRPIPIRFSMGHVTTSDMNAPESLRELLERAGQVRNRQESLLKEALVN
ncbi:MAG TPA: GGDEF domain-containing protein [Terracidiphilus sp.]|nr:GGDEF domain-containing protein [Terracidiphilus sp.]